MIMMRIISKHYNYEKLYLAGEEALLLVEELATPPPMAEGGEDGELK
jgi:hypothetical protein